MVTAAVWVGVLVCGGLGAVARFVLDGAVTRRIGTRFPVGTLAVNLTGALALGVLDGAVLPARAALLAGTAVIGSYTTFSTWMLETQRLGEERRGRYAIANLAVSLAGGLLLAVLGLRIGGAL